MIRKTALAAAALATFVTGGVVGLTAGTANASTIIIRTVYYDQIRSATTNALVRVDGPFQTLAAAQADKARQEAVIARQCAVVPWACYTVTIKPVSTFLRLP